ncbi:MAG: hypothetical protein GW949_06505 [Spirochaetales bacterium]|nr:hypothetical protein [Spirochaetales bacterium]
MGFFALVAAHEGKEYVHSLLSRGAALIESSISFVEIDLREGSDSLGGDFLLSVQEGVLWGELLSKDGTDGAKKPIEFRNWDLLRGEQNLHFSIFRSNTGEVLVSDEPRDFAQFRVAQIIEDGPEVHLQSIFRGYTSPSAVLVDLQNSLAQELGLVVYLADPSLPFGNTSLTRLLFAFFVYLFVTVVIVIGIVDRFFLSRIRFMHGTLPYFEKLIFQDRPLDPRMGPDPGFDEIGTYSREVFTLFLRAQRRTKELRSLVDSLEFREKRLSSRPYDFFSFFGNQISGAVQILTQFPLILQDLENPKEKRQFLETLQIESQKLRSLTQLIQSLGSPRKHDDFPGIFRCPDFRRVLQNDVNLWGGQGLLVTFLPADWDDRSFDLNLFLLVHFWRISICSLYTKTRATDMSFGMSKIAERESKSILRFELAFSSPRADIQKYTLTEETGLQSVTDFLDRHEPVLNLYREENQENLSARYRFVLDLQAKEIKLPQTLFQRDNKSGGFAAINPALLKKIQSSDPVIRTEGLLFLLDLSREHGWLETEQYVILCLGSSSPSCPYRDKILEILTTLNLQEQNE